MVGKINETNKNSENEAENNECDQCNIDLGLFDLKDFKKEYP